MNTAGEQQAILKRASEIATGWPELPVATLRPALAMLCRRITACSERIDIEISARGLCTFLRGEAAAATSDPMQPDDPLLLSVPTRLCRIGQGKRLVIDATARPGISGRPDPKLIKLLVRAHHLKEKLRSMPGRRIADLASMEKLSPSYVAMLLRRPFSPPTSPAPSWRAANPAALPRSSCRLTLPCRSPGPSSGVCSASSDRRHRRC